VEFEECEWAVELDHSQWLATALGGVWIVQAIGLRNVVSLGGSMGYYVLMYHTSK
jgi:hypothetical protein